ncbi:MAG: DUF4149 domain-containing protein [bacterium]|nr:DUF4149 domain-containing protein [bacterium]
MNWIFRYFYQLTLALWVGGMTCFAFLVTPLVFSNLGRDEAAKIVGFLFPVYYPVMAGVSLAALIFYFLHQRAEGFFYKLGILLLVTAVLINLYQYIILFPQAAQLQAQIGSFEAMARENPLRQSFAKLHIQANLLGLLVLIEGYVLLFFAGRK